MDDRSAELGGLLERVALRQQATASILRAAGRAAEAERIEAYASRLRLRLDRPAAARAMYQFARRTRDAPTYTSLMEGALDGALSLMGAQLGNIQLRDPVTGGLRIICHCGFEQEFLEYFAVVDDDASACGRAASCLAQVVVADADRDPAFAPHRDIAAASRFRAVQSTPVIDAHGDLIGVISTHFRRPHRPSDDELRLMAWYADILSAAVAARRHDEPPPDRSEPRLAHTGIVYRYGEAARLRAAHGAAASGAAAPGFPRRSTRVRPRSVDSLQTG